MSRKPKRNTGAEQYIELGELLAAKIPHLWSVLVDEENFIELRIKAKPDGSTLALVKRYGSDGGPMICFGVGYGVGGAMLAINATIQGGSWRVDKPWPGKGK